MDELYRQAISELENVATRIDDHAVDRACEMIADTRRIGVYGCGREGLQLRGFAMRLFHLGRDVSVVGDMTMPPLGAGDLFIVSAGPGYLSTAMALATVARDASAKVLLLTAQPAGGMAALADHVSLSRRRRWPTTGDRHAVPCCPWDRSSKVLYSSSSR
ncbi:SIS domain-containing protein [Mesorhizobium koreense]|uniref:SIS domain-containing protein n=1 Tax=Mesorhizobium koreense TaxID=3074855 RepID=UPI00287B83DC|nr:SIS domain-containing protein [Mesorhizobium sp. WR6]